MLKFAARSGDGVSMGISSIALQGLQQAEVQLSAAANGSVTAGTQTPSGAHLDVVDIASNIVALQSAQTEFELNIDVLKIADKIQQKVLNITT